MASGHDDNVQVYVIPENFIEEGRILNGMIKTRNLVEAIVISGIIALVVSSFFPGQVLQHLSVLITICGPFFVLALIGINEDPLSVVVKNALRWVMHRDIILYNYTKRPQKEAPVDVMLQEETPRDKILQIMNNWQRQRMSTFTTEGLVEGVDFVFRDNENLRSTFESGQATQGQTDNPDSAVSADEREQKPVVEFKPAMEGQMDTIDELWREPQDKGILEYMSEEVADSLLDDLWSTGNEKTSEVDEGEMR